MIGIYKITNKINNKSYIGQSINIEHRWKEHLSRIDDKQFDYAIYNAFRKYGIENFNFEIIEQCKENELNDKEIYWIDYYNSYYDGYNMNLGGNGLRYDYDFLVKTYLECKSLEKAAKKCGCHWNTIRNAVIALGEQTRFNNNQERPIKSINPATGDIVKTYVSLSQAAKDINVTEANFIRCLKEPYNHSVKGLLWFDIDEEIDINKIKQTKRVKSWAGKKIYQLDKNTEEVINIFNSVSEIAKAFGKKDASPVYKALNGQSKTVYGFKWKAI